MQIKHTELVEAFSDNVGKAQAEEIVERAVEETGVSNKTNYEQDEAIDIAKSISDLDDVSSFVYVSANTVQTRIRSGSL